MFKRLIGTSLTALLFAGSAYAANCPPNPYTLTNGTSADAAQVMADFNNLLNCTNNNLAPLANPHFTGNVGIGTASPASSLQVVGVVYSSGPNGFAVGDGSSFTPSGLNSIPNYGIGSITSGSITSIAGFGGSVFYSAQTERMRITQAGNVGIGTIAPSLLFFVNGSAGGTSAYQVISDARLKKNIMPISRALSLISQLNPVFYNWRVPAERSVGKELKLSTDERQIGFVAQEVEKVVPEAVAKPGKGSDATYGLKQENLIPLLVAAIKEQQAEIAQLRASVAALTSATKN